MRRVPQWPDSGGELGLRAQCGGLNPAGLGVSGHGQQCLARWCDSRLGNGVAGQSQERPHSCHVILWVCQQRSGWSRRHYASNHGMFRCCSSEICCRRDCLCVVGSHRLAKRSRWLPTALRTRVLSFSMTYSTACCPFHQLIGRFVCRYAGTMAASFDCWTHRRQPTLCRWRPRPRQR